MANSLIGIELEVGGVLLKFVETAVESAGAAHTQEARYPVYSQRPPLHRHPRQDERFKIIEGALSFRIGDTERVVNAHEEIAIARGELHSALNPGDVPALVIWETRPALRTGEFFVAMDRATRGRTRPAVPRNPPRRFHT